jgi:hypothetical protein
MRHGFKMGACLVALSLAWSGIAQARSYGCARPNEVSAIQVSAIQQELMDAALGCGPQATAQYNAFQTSFGPELRKSDAVLLRMFKRIYGHRKGDAEYNAINTRAAANAEVRRDRGITDFCKPAHLVFQAALAPDKPSLNDFVAGVQVVEESPVDSCQIRVAMTFQGVSAAPAILPTPRPALPGDVPLPVAAAAAAPPAPVTTAPPRVQ